MQRLLPELGQSGMEYVELTTDPDNLPSQKIILANGGVFIESFIKPAHSGGAALRYRIYFRD